MRHQLRAAGYRVSEGASPWQIRRDHAGLATQLLDGIAAAARHLGIIQADLAVALSMSVSHKNIFFDKKMPEVKFPA